MSDNHPMYFQNTLLTPEMVLLYFKRDHQTLRQMALDAIAEITDENFEETGPRAHVLMGLWDSIIDGRAVISVTDTTNC
jgi:hypothetical protein